MNKVLFILLIFMLVACTNKAEPVPDSGIEKEDISEQNEQQIEQESEETEQQNEDLEETGNMFSHDEIIDHLKIGQTQTEVEHQFGNQYVPITGAMENDPWWRFDFGAKEGYEFIGQFEDAIDMEGIQNGDVKLILFVGWSDAKAVSSYIIYYKNETDQKVHEYRVFKDGTIRESVVS